MSLHDRMHRFSYNLYLVSLTASTHAQAQCGRQRSVTDRHQQRDGANDDTNKHDDGEDENDELAVASAELAFDQYSQSVISLLAVDTSKATVAAARPAFVSVVLGDHQRTASTARAGSRVGTSAVGRVAR